MVAPFSLQQSGGVVSTEKGVRLLSIYVSPGQSIPTGAQLGLPRLFNHGSQEQFALLKEWIQDCDSSHVDCRASSSFMPTRLLELGKPTRLIDSTTLKSPRYVALSHCWGRLSEEEKFCTTTHNLEDLKHSVDVSRLPRNFRDAITVTLGIGLKYIWIDSLCIVQDDKDDWNSESVKMENVYSSAYCTIAASSAKSSLHGFLPHREARECVQLPIPGGDTLYICPNIDDFDADVELGELNQRGWVLQERALSRRTIFFSSTQVFWQCSDGVRCETLTRLKCHMASFLGDANFPKYALQYYRDGRQMLIQDLFERYSRQAFTNKPDRAVAILGLQNRLSKALKTKAAFGLFQMYFARLLLWKRGSEEFMERIEQPPDSRHHPPTWSWFSKDGPISYSQLRFEGVEWATHDFKNPFKSRANRQGGAIGCNEEAAVTTLSVLAREIKNSMDLSSYVTFDEDPGTSDKNQELQPMKLKCAVIGRDRVQKREQDQRFHVLIIRQIGHASRHKYERVGVASLKPEDVACEGSWVDVE